MSKLAVVVNNMSSREIAELTGKRHDHVMNDIRKMLEELKIDVPTLLGTYKAGRNFLIYTNVWVVIGLMQS